jgi:CBS domain-containing protein
MIVADIMNSEPYVLHPEDTILSSSNFMKEERVRNLPVVDKTGKLLGLITLREIIEAAYGNTPKATVKEAMLKEIVTVRPETPLKGAIEVMLMNRFGCLPVIDKDKNLLGMITEADLLKTLYDLTKVPDDFYKFYNVD